MSLLIPVTAGSAAVAVGAASAEFALTLNAKAFYVVTSTVACWAAQADTSATAAAAGANSILIPAFVPTVISGALGNKLALIQASVAGTASIARLQVR